MSRVSRQLGSKSGKFFLLLPFCSQTFTGLDDAHPQWGGQDTLLSPPIQMLTLSRNTLTDTPVIIFNLGTSWPSQVDIRVSSHSELGRDALVGW